MIKKAVIKVSLLIILGVISSIFIYYKVGKSDITSDEKRFKVEYESLNNQKDASGNTYLSLDIDKNNNFVYATFDEIKEIITKGDGVIYFGHPENPWCRLIVPVLIEAMENTDLDEIYYFDADDIRDIKELDANGKINILKEGTTEYYELVDLLKDYLPSYQGLNDEAIKRIYFPTVIFVKDGQIVASDSSILNEKENPYTPLSDEEQRLFVNKMIENINNIVDSVCDDECNSSD